MSQQPSICLARFAQQGRFTRPRYSFPALFAVTIGSCRTTYESGLTTPSRASQRRQSQNYEMVLSKDPKNSEALDRLVRLLLAQGQIDEGIKVIEQAEQSQTLSAPLAKPSSAMLT